MAKPRKTGKPKALDDEEIDEVTESIAPGPQSIDAVVAELFGTETYQHTKGSWPPIAWLQERFKTKSAIIRWLFEDQGSKPEAVKQIAKQYGFKYQHVRNVLTNELKRGPNEPFRLDDHYNIKLTVPSYAPRLQPRSREEPPPIAPVNNLDLMKKVFPDDDDDGNS